MMQPQKMILKFLSALGRGTENAFSYMAVLGVFVYLPLRRTLFPPYRGMRSITRTAVMQIYFTGVQALPLFIFLSLLTGLSLSIHLVASSPIQSLLLNFFLKGVAPGLAALIILGRSGTAVTVELGNMTVLGEVRLLRRMGIDPFRHLIFPRLLGVTLSTSLLNVLFGIAIVTVAAVFSIEPFYVFIKELLADWTLVDVAVFAEKGVLFGLIISMVACYHGLSLEPATTEVPKATIRTVIHGIILCATVDFVLEIL